MTIVSGLDSFRHGCMKDSQRASGCLDSSSLKFLSAAQKTLVTRGLQGFLTGVLQMHARKHQLPIDTLRFEIEVSTWGAAEEVDVAADNGVYVHGLYLEGGRWDIHHGYLADAERGIMHSQLPVVHFKPVQDQSVEAKGHQYLCPVYKTSTRAGTLSTTGQSTNYVVSLELPIDPSTTKDFWIRRGTALLCMLDT